LQTLSQYLLRRPGQTKLAHLVEVPHAVATPELLGQVGRETPQQLFAVLGAVIPMLLVLDDAVPICQQAAVMIVLTLRAAADRARSRVAMMSARIWS
jgi:hypothetical protein